MTMDIDYEHGGFRRLEVVDTGRRRRWTVASKVRIVEESLAAGSSVSSVARRHGLAPSQLFCWRRQFLGLGSGVSDAPAMREDAGGFVPVVVQAELPISAPLGANAAIVIEMAGQTVRIAHDAPAGLVTAVMRALPR
jgi:transposase